MFAPSICLWGKTILGNNINNQFSRNALNVYLKSEKSLYAWMSGFSSETLERLRRINQASSTSRHIVAAISYGFVDRDLYRVNRLIIGLMLRRHKAERQGDVATIEKIELRLKELHRVINALVGPPPQGVDDVACRSVKK